MRPEQLAHPLVPLCPRCKRRHRADMRCWVGSYAQKITRHVLDSQGRTCWICGNTATSADHVVPRSLGGSDADENLRPCCGSCNARKNNRDNPFLADPEPVLTDVPLAKWLEPHQAAPAPQEAAQERPRLVVVLFGPPAAGKSTLARTLGLEVFDRDELKWSGEHEFQAALAALRFQRWARAVVIRTGATRATRRRTLVTVNATHAFMLATPEAICLERARERGGNVPHQVRAIRDWWRDYDQGTDLPVWDGTWSPNDPLMRVIDHA